MFTVKMNVFTVNSQLSGCNCVVSALQQMDMKIPEVSGDATMNIVFCIEMTLEQVQAERMTGQFRQRSTIRENIPMRHAQDVERLAVAPAAMVTEWYSPLGGNWIGTIPYTHENLKVLMELMSSKYETAAAQ